MKSVALILSTCLLVSGCAAQTSGRSDVAANDMAEAENGAGELYSEVVARMGAPENEEDFVMTWDLLEFRIELRNFFDRDRVEAGEITLRECTWSLEGTENLTIWFQKDGDTWRRVHSLSWNDGDLF